MDSNMGYYCILLSEESSTIQGVFWDNCPKCALLGDLILS